VFRREGRASIPVSQQVLVEPRQEVHAGGWRGCRQGFRRKVVRHPVELELDQLPVADREAAAHVAHREPGPSRKIAHGGRPVASEVAEGQLPERLVMLQPPRLRYPLVEQGEGLLPALGGSQDERGGLGEVPEEMVAALSVGPNPSRGDGGEDGIPGEDAAAGQRRDGDLASSLHVSSGDPEDGATRCGRGERPGRGELQHPAEILRGHEVQRPAHRPGPRDLAGVAGRVHRGLGRPGHADAHRPFRAG
jgi:hypothetical protein